MNLDKFREKRILVIGDVMLDEYIFGDVTRLSPEAPIPIINYQKSHFTFGGAANVANNLASLKGQVYLCGIIGNDKEAETFYNLIKQNGIHNSTIQDKERPTTVKQRVLARYPGHPYQQIVRIDKEYTKTISRFLEIQTVENIKSIVDEVDCIILSEYDKGFLTKYLVDTVKELANGKTIIANAKPSKIDLYKNLDWVIFNTSETEATTDMKYLQDDEDLTRNIGKAFIRKYNPEYFLMTAGADGMFLYHKDDYNYITTTAREVADVSGAGDTVAAALALAIASGLDPIESVKIANCAAGIVVEKTGTATVSLEELTAALEINGISKP